MGPAAELEKLKEPMGGLGTVFWETDEGSMWFSKDDNPSQDSHVTIVPYFTVPDGKMDEFKAGFPDFYKGSKNAEAVLAHLGDVKAPLDEAVAMVGEGGLKL